MNKNMRSKTLDKNVNDLHGQLENVNKDYVHSSLRGSFSFSLTFLFIGIILVYVAERDVSSIVFSLIFAFVGIAVVLLCNGNRYEYRAFILSYSVCVFVMGLSFNYSLSNFNTLMSTLDSAKFVRIINDSNTTLEKLRFVVDATLPALIWKYLATFRHFLHIGSNGPSLYILLNAALIGMTNVFITKIANDLFSSDYRRVKLAGTLFSLCGMGWLFGSLLIRDSYALFLNTLSVWCIIKVLVNTNLKNLILAIVVLTASAWFMLYVREKAFYLFFLFGIMGFVLWYLKSKLSPLKIIFLFVFMVVGLMVFDQISSHTIMATDATSEESEKYTIGARATARSGSLGAALVVNQPLFVRLFVGSAYVLIFPIPLWGYFQIGLPEYFIIKGMHGLFMVLLLPSVIYSAIKIFSKKAVKGSLYRANLFIFFYFLITVMLVGVTTLETRHLGQFLSAFIILSAMPIFNSQRDKRLLTKIRVIWFGMILSGHLAWMLLRM